MIALPPPTTARHSRGSRRNRSRFAALSPSRAQVQHGKAVQILSLLIPRLILWQPQELQHINTSAATVSRKRANRGSLANVYLERLACAVREEWTQAIIQARSGADQIVQRAQRSQPADDGVDEEPTIHRSQARLFNKILRLLLTCSCPSVLGCPCQAKHLAVKTCEALKAKSTRDESESLPKVERAISKQVLFTVQEPTEPPRGRFPNIDKKHGTCIALVRTATQGTSVLQCSAEISCWRNKTAREDMHQVVIYVHAVCAPASERRAAVSPQKKKNQTGAKLASSAD